MEVEPAAQPEAVYVVLDLQEGVEVLPEPGTHLRLEGMETQQPCLRLPDGSRLVGAFEETVGSQLVLADTLGPDGSHRVELVGHTDKRITFSRPPQEAEGQDGDDAGGEAAAAAAAAPP
ncbi:general transcription factor 3C polypeptide 6-like [Chlorella sorokiniana]|uniref:General transcription factor 3C polypeptide 6-like n=1 Tax=Chlorella sorokiniana TaxID=3076 RepID=A0A2P6TV22_CHLSO|nr:general transcription factor 3C polypeptide 6-like [Chlorella sorokiniana]|eukprot:PRW57896.1 general transcription factor 3C polypeptide 6-like [Chlorella sorokiniana]